MVPMSQHDDKHTIRSGHLPQEANRPKARRDAHPSLFLSLSLSLSYRATPPTVEDGWLQQLGHHRVAPNRGMPRLLTPLLAPFLFSPLPSQLGGIMGLGP
jgi:hypothetical protein